MAAGAVYYYSFLIATTATAFQFICRDNGECTVCNLYPEHEGTFVLQHIPEHADTLTFSQLIATTIDHTMLAKLPPSITYLVVNQSARVRNIIVPSNNSIEQLFIIKTRLSAISFEENDTLYQLSIENARLNRIPPTLTNLRNLSYVKIKHTPLQQLDLSLFCNFRRLQTIDLNYNRIYFIAVHEHPDCGPSLVEIWLANNRLKRINPNVFVQFSRLASVTLSSNSIDAITGGFKNTQIHELALGINLMSKLELCEWSLMPYVTEFSIQRNKLINVPECLERMPNLLELNLEYNQLMYVSIDVFRELKKLRYLRLGWNPIVSFTIDEHSLPPSLRNIDMLHDLLQYLNISRKWTQAVIIRT